MVLLRPCPRPRHSHAPAAHPSPPHTPVCSQVSALKEIEWVAQASQQCPSLKYYYLGFYLHNCHRMRYKVGQEGATWAT